MKKTMYRFASICAALLISVQITAAPKDIPLSDVPADVIQALNQYLEVLSKSKSVDQAAAELIRRDLAGGHLTTGDKSDISRDVREFSLKKDFENVKFYSLPAVITRVSFSPEDYDGFKETLFEGARYKIFIKKKPGTPGMPAPIPLIKPKNGKPKIVSVIGSL